ncbi:MAG: SRPBCC domain-containing protein [Myxococcaceae bacterium]
MAENISVSDIIPASAERVYTAFLDAKQHGAMTGAHATDEGDGRFTAWDGYISGRTVSAVPHLKIVQAWRTTEFPEGDPDSMLTILFEAADGGTKVTFQHENIPDGQGDNYAKGWEDFYFTPMKKHFGGPLEKMKESVDEAIEGAKESVAEALEEAKEQATETVKELKKAQKKAAAAIKKVGAQVGKKAKALVAKAKKAASRASPKKKAAPKKVASKKPAKKQPAKKASKPAKKKKR